VNNTKLQKLRHSAFIEQGCKCIYCELPMWERDPSEVTARFRISLKKAKLLQCTAEHLLAAQDGGKDNCKNISAACLWCNRMRHYKRQDKAPDPGLYKKRVLQLIRKKRWHPAVGIRFSSN
jgi:hypothetical protein